MTASAIAVTTPYPLFNDVDGQPLEGGRVWVGLPGLDPKTNQKDIFWDEDLTIPAAQPVATKGGYPQFAATPRRFFCDGDYSILVENRYGVPVYGAQSNNIPSFYAARSVDVCSVRDFGAPGTGNAVLDTKAFEDAIAFAAQVVTNGPIDYDNVTAAVRIPAGKYILSRTIELANCVSIIGDGSGAVEIFVEHTGIGFRAPAGATYANILLEGFKMTSGGSATQAIYYEGMIRGCVTRDVFPVGFVDSFYTTNTWTNRFENCQSLSPTRSHFRFETGTGLQWIEGGRFDEAVGFGVYANSAEAEIVITGNAAIQFGRTSAVRVDNAPTIVLDQVFIEGNCISNVTNYHIELFRPDAPVSNNLTSATVKGVTINNRDDPLRNGLGIMSVRNYKTFTYEERWVRNGVSEVPTVGVGVENISVSLNSASSRSSLLTGIAWNSQNHAIIRQVARPTLIAGEDMLSGGPATDAPTVRAALNVGLDAIGVAVGTSAQKPALQSYGGILQLNPHGLDIELVASLVRVSATTGEVWGRTRTATSVTSSNAVPGVTIGYLTVDCTGGSRTVTLTNFPTENVGSEITIGKSDSGANTLTITPASGTINGSATLVLSAAYAHVTLITNGVNWFIKNKSY
jgi:hypothetical protein